MVKKENASLTLELPQLTYLVIWKPQKIKLKQQYYNPEELQYMVSIHD